MKFVARIYDIAAFCVKREIFFKQCSKCGFAGFAADVDFGCLIVLHLQFQFLSRTQDELHHVFIRTITFHKNWRFNFAQNFRSMPAQQQRWKPVGSTGTGRVDWPVGLPVGSTGRLGYRSGRDSSTGRSSRLKHRSNSPFLQLQDI